MAGFVTDAQVTASVAAALHKGVGDLDAFWAAVVTDANQAAYDAILDHFILCGYSAAQIGTWDRGATFQRFLARYQALIDGAGDKDEVGEWRTELDYWRKKLGQILTLDAGGAIADPVNAQGEVGHGSLSTTNDIFRLGQPGSCRTDGPNAPGSPVPLSRSGDCGTEW